MLINLLAEGEAAASKSSNGWVMWVIIGVVLVLMVVLTIVPQKKRQKEQQKMMNALTVGTKLMTVGGLVGKITQVNTDDTLIINVGTENSPTLIVIQRNAVGRVLEPVNAPAPVEPVAEETPAVEPFNEEVVETPVEETAVEESSVDDSDPFSRKKK